MSGLMFSFFSRNILALYGVDKTQSKWTDFQTSLRYGNVLLSFYIRKKLIVEQEFNYSLLGARFAPTEFASEEIFNLFSLNKSLVVRAAN